MKVMQINESGAFLLFNTNLSGQEELPVYLFESGETQLAPDCSRPYLLNS